MNTEQGRAPLCGSHQVIEVVLQQVRRAHSNDPHQGNSIVPRPIWAQRGQRIPIPRKPVQVGGSFLNDCGAHRLQRCLTHQEVFQAHQEGQDSLGGQGRRHEAEPRAPD